MGVVTAVSVAVFQILYVGGRGAPGTKLWRASYQLLLAVVARWRCRCWPVVSRGRWSRICGDRPVGQSCGTDSWAIRMCDVLVRKT